MGFSFLQSTIIISPIIIIFMFITEYPKGDCYIFPVFCCFGFGELRGRKSVWGLKVGILLLCKDGVVRWWYREERGEGDGVVWEEKEGGREGRRKWVERGT